MDCIVQELIEKDRKCNLLNGAMLARCTSTFVISKKKGNENKDLSIGADLVINSLLLSKELGKLVEY